MNTKFFHLSTIVRRQKNSIEALQSDAGCWVNDRASIGALFQTHFSALFKSSEPDLALEIQDFISPVITQAENEDLCWVPDDMEIHCAVKELGGAKSPGPDGLTASSYQKFWPTVSKSVCSMVKSFFHSGYLLKQLNHTFIALIPKTANPASVSQFRPISLCNVSYKIISKLLANRLKQVLSKLISPTQTAFVPGRVIQEKSVVASELIHSI